MLEGNSLVLGELSRMFEFEMFKITNISLILYSKNGKTIKVPLSLCKFDVKQFPYNTVCYITKENNKEE